MSIVADFTQPNVELALLPPFQPPLLRVSVDQYHAMLRHGILMEGDEVELLDGLLVTKMTKNTAHRLAKWLAQNALTKVAPEGWYVDSQDAITLESSEPEPDVMVIRGQPRDYLEHHPMAGQLALVVEVSDSSLRFDRGVKKVIYASAAIPVYWIINLVDRQVEVYTEPTGAVSSGKADYRQPQIFSETEQVPVVIDGREVARIAVRELLP